MTWKKVIREEWEKRQQERIIKDGHFPLVFQNFTSDEVLAMFDVVMSGQLTMSNHVKRFESEFAKYVGAPYAVMVNSGSSANLLALAVASNPMKSQRLMPGDEVLVPAVCWSTSVWPIIQMGMKPIFIDVNPETLNMDLSHMKKVITKKTKAILAVHILGNATDMRLLKEFCDEQKLMLIEDTCESLGSKSYGKVLGTIGQFGTYSFYFSHHMTTGEGGMVICQTQEDYDLLKSLRAHGWTRELSNRSELEAQYPEVDPRFLFVNVGYNLRPMEIQAALGLKQLERLPEMNSNRVANNNLIIESLKRHPKWKNQFLFTHPGPGVDPVWFGFCLQLEKDYTVNKSKYLEYLSQRGVENRPIVSGNFARQPAFKLFNLAVNPNDLQGAEQIHNSGFFIGVHTDRLSESQVNSLCDILLGFQ